MVENEKVLSSEVSSRIVTEDQLLKIHNTSLEDWEIEKKIINTWEVGSKDTDGNLIITPLFQVKVWLRSKKALQSLEELKEAFFNQIKEYSPKIEAYSRPTKLSSPRTLEINIFDLHLGKVAWAEETGADYDLKIACNIFNEAIDEFLLDIDQENIEEIIIPIGNDFFNADKAHPFDSTTRGTPQQEDTRWQKTFKTGWNLLVKNIEKLTKKAPVRVVVIPGNHDYERMFYVGEVLYAWFINNENVTVDNSPSPRKYYGFGKVLLGFTHGNEEKVQDLPLIMAQEVPGQWAISKYREIHLGHFHSKKEIKYKSTEEYNGTIIRYMGSLTAPDSWHHKKGYVGATRRAEAYLWDHEKGLKAIYNFSK